MNLTRLESRIAVHSKLLSEKGWRYKPPNGDITLIIDKG